MCHNLYLLSIRIHMREGRRGTPQVALTEGRPLFVGWIKLIQGRVGALYREGAQVGHKAGSHQHITRDVVKHVLQILHSLLPANLLIC